MNSTRRQSVNFNTLEIVETLLAILFRPQKDCTVDDTSICTSNSIFFSNTYLDQVDVSSRYKNWNLYELKKTF